jgi:competence protein ComEA
MKHSAWKRNRERNRDQTGGILLLLLLLVTVQGLQVVRSGGEKEAAPAQRLFSVQITGDVPRPGVYSFSKEPSLQDLLRRSGHRGEDPSVSLDVGRRLVSGTSLHVQNKEGCVRIRMRTMSAFHRLTMGLPLSLNGESEEGLTALSGIGPNLARRIVREREARGGFKRVEDLTGVRGVGPVLLRKVKPYLVL